MPSPNYDEALIGSLPIPDLLIATDGGKITTREAWLAKRRPELLQAFSAEVYGRTPAARVAMRVRQAAPDKVLFGGKGVMSQTTLEFVAPTGRRAEAALLLILPAAAPTKPAPVFVNLNFGGNHSVSHDPDILLSEAWFRDKEAAGYVNHRATPASRGSGAAGYPLEAMLDRGHGLATACYGDFDPDVDDGFRNGIHALFSRAASGPAAGSEWGAIGAWAWGLGRMADHLLTLPQVDGRKLVAVGHSRLGKAALWAGVQDARFAIVISNNSGAGGAALARRNYGETVRDLNTSFPHWFCRNYHLYSGNEGALPVDQHALLALVAPRPLYVASATEDRWADPKGEFLSAKLAEPVYAFFGLPGLGVETRPSPDTPVGAAIGYHLRTGHHALTPYDWERFMDFVDKHFARD